MYRHGEAERDAADKPEKAGADERLRERIHDLSLRRG
jgi:hypothetical protein